jgi:hypothetical protein
MTNDDLVHADTAPDQPLSGQQPAVQTARTMGKICRDASGLYASLSGYVTEEGWEAAADAVIEECAKIAERKFFEINYSVEGLELSRAIAAELRSLKSSPGRVVDRTDYPQDQRLVETNPPLRKGDPE